MIRLQRSCVNRLDHIRRRTTRFLSKTASVNDALLQYQADIMQLPVVRPKVTETTALGAAYLAGLATGLWKGRDAISGHWKVDRRFEPQMSADQAASTRAQWTDAVQRSRGWAKDK